MKEKLTKWADAGDGDCMYKLAKIYQDEGNISQYRNWLEKSAETKNFDAMKEYAELLRSDDTTIQNYDRALNIYKELSETFRDEESMEAIVDMCAAGQGVPQNDKETLNFVLGLIDKMFNDIYTINGPGILARIMTFLTRRHNELTMETLQAIERRRIASRIRRILKG